MSLSKKILVITDNALQYQRFKKIIENKNAELLIDYKHSSIETEIHHLPEFIDGHAQIDVKSEMEKLISDYDLIFSIHCYQFFPKELVNSVKCINIHPGYNPINRGWYPQVFAIINNLEVGATIHEMDEKIDHGKIIDRKKVPIYAWDTSYTVYNRVLEAEMELLEKNIDHIISDSYVSIEPENEGNIFTKKDFKDLCRIDLNEVTTYQAVINKLRGLTHGYYKNAWFIDEKTGKKIHISINMASSDE